MEQYTLKLTSGTSYRLYQGSTLVTDSDLTALFSTAGSAYFNFDFNGGTPSATNTAVIVDSNGVTIVTITATILDSANYKGVWGDSATTFTSFDSLSGKSLDESQLSFLMGEIKESPVVGTDISTVINTAFVSTANIQSDAVTTSKIADYNVTAEKLASESITTAKIEDGAVTMEKLAVTVLYEDATGTTDGVNLSDSAENYSYIEIFFKDAVRSSSVKVADPQGKNVFLFLSSVSSSGNYANFKTGFINNNHIGAMSYNQLALLPAGIQVNTNNNISITKVLGYK